MLESYVRPGTVPYSLDHILQILVHRDNLTPEEAQSRLDDCLSEMKDALQRDDYHALDDIIMDELGLEPDFALSLLDAL